MKSNETIKPEDLQVRMHVDFFKKTQDAIDRGFYLEAIFREYATIEARLEVIMGILGAPCNKNAEDEKRRKVEISTRIECLKGSLKNVHSIGKSNLTPEFLKRLDKWRDARNRIVHGFYKNELLYGERTQQNGKLAKDGFLLARTLYNEAKRLRRYLRSHPDVVLPVVVCREQQDTVKCMMR